MRRLSILPLVALVVLVMVSYPTTEVAIAITGSGTISVTIPATVSIHMISSSIDFGSFDPNTAQKVTIGTTTYYVLDSENDATDAPAKISWDEYDTNVEAIYYISDITASTSGSTTYTFGADNVFVKRDTSHTDYGYYTPAYIEVTLSNAGSSFTPTLPSGYTEVAQATYTTYVRSSSDGNSRNPTQVTIYISLAQDSNGKKYLFVDDDTDFTDSSTDSTPPVSYTELHQIKTIYDNPYGLVGSSFPAASGDTVKLAQAAIAQADESVSSTVMGFYVLIIVPSNANAITVTRTVTITGEAV